MAKENEDPRAPNEYLYWHLYNKFHANPTMGHSVNGARDCWMCNQFEVAARDWLKANGIEMD